MVMPVKSSSMEPALKGYYVLINRFQYEKGDVGAYKALLKGDADSRIAGKE